jgi:hypothetical protein
MRMSSTNNKWRILIILDTFIPIICPSDWAFFKDRLSPAMTKIKSKGESGHPCLSPSLLNNLVASPLIRVVKEVETTQAMIKFVVLIPKPLW